MLSGLSLIHRAADDTEIARFFAGKDAKVVHQRLHKMGMVGLLENQDGVALTDGDQLQEGTYKFYDAPAAAPTAAGAFTSEDDWQMLICDGTLGIKINNVEHVPKRLVQMNISSPQYLFDLHKKGQLAALLNVDVNTARAIGQSCGTFAGGTYSRSTLLKQPLGRILHSLRLASSSQQDNPHPYHPTTVKSWDSFDDEMKEFQADRERTPTKDLFLFWEPSSDQKPAGEGAVQSTVEDSVVRTVNPLLRYDARQEKSRRFQLQPGRTTATPDSQIMKELAEDDLSMVVSRLALNKIEELDFVLVADDGPFRPELVIGEVKRAERLFKPVDSIEDETLFEECSVKVFDTNGVLLYNVRPPSLVKFWNKPLEFGANTNAPHKSTYGNVVGLLSQLARYCGPRGVRHAFATNYYFWWAFHIIGDGVFEVSRAIPYNSTDPSPIALLYFLLSKAIKAMPATGWLPSWSPATERSPQSDTDGGTGGDGGSGRHAGDTAPGGERPKGNMSDSNRSTIGGSKQCGAGGGRPQASSSRQLFNSSSSPRSRVKMSSVLASMQHAGSTRDWTNTLAQYDQQEDGNSYASLHTAPHIDPLEATAACLDVVKQSHAVIGSGASGLVFSCKMPDGMLLAVKAVPLESKHVAVLQNEADVLRALREYWDVVTPALCAVGPGYNNRGFLLATRYVEGGRHLNPATDQCLLPELQQMLAAVHARQVSHNDIRADNVLVQECHEGKHRAWLIDWGFSSLNATEEAKERDRVLLEGLFS